jgi:hypothetical protein
VDKQAALHVPTVTSVLQVAGAQLQRAGISAEPVHAMAPPIVHEVLRSPGEPSDAARNHEAVQSALSPKHKHFREFRADLRTSGFRKSQFLRYLDEALAETYAQLNVKGITGLPSGIQFRVKTGYVTLSGVATETAIGTVVLGGITYGVYVVIARHGRAAAREAAVTRGASRP